MYKQPLGGCLRLKTLFHLVQNLEGVGMEVGCTLTYIMSSSGHIDTGKGQFLMCYKNTTFLITPKCLWVGYRLVS